MDGYDNFDFSQVKNIKFNYDYPRDIYLDDFTFIPSVVAQGKTGFITAQHEIPDYGSAESGKLEYPEGAQYTLEKASGATQEYRIGSDGMFALADGETATFKDQFRRGSYISVTEDINTDVFETTWTLYENGSPVRSMNDGSSINIVDPVSVNGGQNMTGVENDGSLEILSAFCQSCITGAKAPNLVEEAYCSTMLCLLGNEAMEKREVTAFPDRYRIPYMKF